MKTLSSYFLVVLLLLAVSAQAQNGAPENLTASVNSDGHVVLQWQTPAGFIPSEYQIWRGYIVPDMVLAQIHGPTELFTDYRVKPGDTYKYAVVAVYSKDNYAPAYTSIKVVPPPSYLRFVSVPRATAVVGKDYFYITETNVPDRRDISIMLVGAVPDGMRAERLFDGTSWIHWVPNKVGQYNITVQATDQATGAQAYQEFTITVADKPGTVQGWVKNTIGDPLPNSTVRVWSTSPGYYLKYETTTDDDGNFLLEDVQQGQLIAFASEPTGAYAARFYINANTINDAMQRPLKAGETLDYPFYLLAKDGTPAPVSGRVVDLNDEAVAGAKVSFIRKEHFIQIGDTTQVNSWQGTALNWRESIVDTALTTGLDGRFVAHLPVGQDYYTVVEKEGHLRSFLGEQTNAMEARAIRVENNLSLSYTIPAVNTTSNKLIGKVLSQVTGVSKQATVVLIDSELKRGAGGTHTYRKYRSVVTDTNGVFILDNLPDSPPSALLAIPMDARLAPQYYHSSGGRMNFRESEELTPLGTVQNIDFELKSTTRSGLGSCFGKVEVDSGQSRTPLSGTLVIAERERDGSIAGYSITDSTGWYSITGLDPDNYLVYADHPEYSYAARYTAAIPSRTMPVPVTYISADDRNRILDVDFLITDLQTTDVEAPVTPSSIVLHQNYPNPFNPTTEIRFSLPQRAHVTLRVINTLGEVVAVLHEGVADAGSHAVTFSAGNNPSGVYFYQLLSDGKTLGRSMMLTK
ncbi:MAG: T9SS type A sorting domain-containing protein [Bacteroidia bacterium]|nr:T9SS type A sorting domain-containing protein [Bacteroidia bacterium]